MALKNDSYKVRSRDEKFTTKPKTKIWYEEPDPKNPYIAKNCLCHGYDLLELAQNCSFIEVLFLLFKGELPSNDESNLLETLMISLVNPGPRHAATRSSMISAVSKTNTAHLLPISLSVLSGESLGASEVENSMKFIRKSSRQKPLEVAHNLINHADRQLAGDWHIAPGFGSRFGSLDIMPNKIANMLLEMPGSGKILNWCKGFVTTISKEELGWLSTGVAAATFLDLGFHPRIGPGLYQLISAPGLLAHGIEMANKPITAMPFIDNENYIIE